MTTIRTAGRTDIAALFAQSGILEARTLDHTPFLAFVAAEDGIDVQIIHTTDGLVMNGLPDSTPVMVQWRGQWRSDFFQFTIGDVRTYLLASER